MPAASASNAQGGGLYTPDATNAFALDSTSTSSTAGQAPNTYIVPSVSVLGTQSSNAGFGSATKARSDTIVDVVPSLFLATDHARWHARADLSIDGTYYARGTQPDVVAPQGYARLHSELIDRAVYFDAAVNATRTAINPYVAQGGALQASTYTSTEWRISPYIDRLLRPGLRLHARSDDTWTTVSNTPQGAGVNGGRYLDQTLRLTQAPVDWGYAIAAEQTYATYNNQPFAWLRDTTARLSLDRALTPHLVAGVVGGHEQVRASGAEDSTAIYGFTTNWHGASGSQVQVRVEHRYFGTGWDVTAGGGSQQLRVSGSWRRDAVSSLAPLGRSGNSGSNLLGLLNSMLAGRYPNPLQRAQAVQNLLGSAGLPANLQSSGGFFTTSTVLQNNLMVSGLLLRPRDSFALSLYRSRTQDLFLPGQQLQQLIQTISADNMQSGAAFNYGHRLTPLDNINLTVQREVDTGFGLNQGRDAHQTNLIVQIDHRFSPATIGIAGARRRLLDSSIAGLANETGVFAGLVHRF